MPLYVKSTVDDLMGSTTISGYEDALFLSFKIGGIYILLSIGKGFFLFLMRQTIIVMSRFIEFDLKNEVFLSKLYVSVCESKLYESKCETFGIIRPYVATSNIV